MQRGNTIAVRIPKATLNFGLTHGGNPSAMINFVVPDQGLAAGKHLRSIVTYINLWSATAIKYGIRFFSTAGGGDNADPDQVKYIGEWAFGNTGTSGDGATVVGDNFKYYATPDIGIRIRDDDNAGKLHFQVINYDAAVDKPAAANLVIEIGLEPTQGI